MNFDIRTNDNGTVDIWRVGTHDGIPDGRVERDGMAPGGWGSIVKSREGPLAVTSGKSQAEGVARVLDHLEGWSRKKATAAAECSCS